MNDAMSATNATDRAENPHKIRRITPRQRSRCVISSRNLFLVPKDTQGTGKFDSGISAVDQYWLHLSVSNPVYGEQELYESRYRLPGYFNQLDSQSALCGELQAGSEIHGLLENI